MKAPKQTLMDFWELLTPEQRRLIHDLLKSAKYNRKNLNIGLLPFIPVKEVISVLVMAPMSPWTDALWQAYHKHSDRRYGYEYYHLEASKHTRYAKSYEHDKAMYAEIIKILTPPKPEAPSHFAEQMYAWLKHAQEEKGA